MSNQNEAIVDPRLLARAPKRPVHILDVPAELSDGSGVTSLGLHELTSEEEIMVVKRTQSAPMRLAFELIKQSIAEVNGTAVSVGDGTTDIWWDKFPPKLRHALASVWREIHQGSEEAEEAFRKSRRVKV